MMSLRRLSILPVLIACLTAAISPTDARAEGEDETFDSAVFMLRRSMVVTRDGRHNMMLRALRQLRDPKLEPFFSELAQSENPTLKIHGLLGLAEASDERKLDLVRVAAIDNAAIQAEVIGAALDSDLVSDEQAKQLINWPGLDVGIKVLVAAPLVKKGILPDRTFLQETAKDASNLGRSALCHLMLLELGDAGAFEQLKALNKSADPKRDLYREMVLQAALRYEFDGSAPWAMLIATEPGVGSRLGVLAMRAALRFRAPGAVELWQRQFASNEDVAERTRLALIVMQLSPWMPESIYEPLAGSDDPLVVQIGVVGRAVASGKDVSTQIIALVQMNHPIANHWAMTYAREYANPADAQAILLALIQAADSGPVRHRAQRLDDAVSATQVLSEMKNVDFVKLLQPLLSNPQLSPDLTQAVLVGLMRSETPDTARVMDGLPPFDNPTTNSVAIALLAKSGRKLNAQQLSDLSLAVRGGGSLLPTLRLQAAWTYLKITDQTREALAEVLGG